MSAGGRAEGPAKGGTDRPLWSGRFAGSLDPRIRSFTASLELDKRIALHDIRGSVAHARMLGRQGIITKIEATQIADTLEAIAADVASGAFVWPADAEDVHSAVERALIERAGAVGGKLHTARSRNDQIALDLRLLVVELLDDLDRAVKALALALVAGSLRFDRQAMKRATERGMLTATDLADHLAKSGVPFREAHEIVGSVVRERLAAGKDLAGITLDELRAADKRFGPAALEEITAERSLAARSSPGGTAPDRVRAALEDARRVLRG